MLFANDVIFCYYKASIPHQVRKHLVKVVIFNQVNKTQFEGGIALKSWSFKIKNT